MSKKKIITPLDRAQIELSCARDHLSRYDLGYGMTTEDYVLALSHIIGAIADLCEIVDAHGDER